MLFHLLNDLREQFGPLNVFRYVSFRVMIALATSLVVTMALYPWFIRRLAARQIGQAVREEITEHQGKRNTPTMGGLLFILAAVVSTWMWSDLTNPYVWFVTLLTLAFAGIGFVDDALKLGVRGSKGLSERGKVLAQSLFGGLALVWLFYGGVADYSTELHLPFMSVERFVPHLPAPLYIAFGIFFLFAVSNAVNITDGMDGLAIGPTYIAALVYLVLAYVATTTLTYTTVVNGTELVASFDIGRYLLLPRVEGTKELSIFCGALIGAGTGFLWHNAHPARVFMGDVGSLGLGGALGAMALLTKNELLSVIILGLFVIEAGSSLIQRYSYRWFGRRVFRIAPIHHHFQRLEWSETQIVVRFWIVAILFGFAALASLKLR